MMCFSYEFHWRRIYPTAGTCWVKPARTHLCRISIQCSNAFLKVGAINRLITNTVESIPIRGKSLSEIVLSTLAESGGARGEKVFRLDLYQKQKKLGKVIWLVKKSKVVEYFGHTWNAKQRSKRCTTYTNCGRGFSTSTFSQTSQC